MMEEHMTTFKCVSHILKMPAKRNKSSYFQYVAFFSPYKAKLCSSKCCNEHI